MDFKYLDTRPKNKWWRKLLGFKIIWVIDKVRTETGNSWVIEESHYEWQWSPFRKR